ncbi:MAG: metal-dependent hydrolase, partial [Cryobacterium sp.]|nr:metal-dependent hydrolase [Cryobacterium sp.]
MMGAHHAMTGTAAWIAVTATAGHGLGLFPVTPVGTIAGALLCAGAALLADADHNSATISQSVPILGRLVTTGISRASGGHRHGLHSLLGLFSAWLLATVIGLVLWEPVWATEPVRVGPALMSAAAIAFAAKVLGLSNKSWGLAWAIGLAQAAVKAGLAPGKQRRFVGWFTRGLGGHQLGE